MYSIQPRRTRWLRIMGSVLLCLGLGLAGGWFFWLVPFVQPADPVWREQFSEKALWKATQNRIRRLGWSHDDFGAVGEYGDKQWAEWIIHRLKPGQDFSDFGPSQVTHADSALEYLTAQDPTTKSAKKEEADAAGAWLAWWQTNQQKTQVQWIQDGLRLYGVTAHLPPDPADWAPLLALLGQSGTNRDEVAPRYISYNACRWLRDSGFEAIPYALSNLTASAEVRVGLLRYAKFEGTHPRHLGLGILPLVENYGEFAGLPRPAILMPRVRWTVYGIIFATISLGSGLLIGSCRKPAGGPQLDAVKPG